MVINDKYYAVGGLVGLFVLFCFTFWNDLAIQSVSFVTHTSSSSNKPLTSDPLDSCLKKFTPHDGILGSLNCDFHNSYDDLVAETVKSFGSADPIDSRPAIVDVQGKLIFLFNGTRDELLWTTTEYHSLKVVGHGLFSIFTLLSSPRTILSQDKREKVEMLLSHLEKAVLPFQTNENLSEKAREVGEKILKETSKFTTNILHLFPVADKNDNAVQSKEKRLVEESINLSTELQLFYNEMLYDVQILFEESMKPVMEAVDKSVEFWLSKLNAKEKSRIGIFISTSHQAKAFESMSLYFTEKLSFDVGYGASIEDTLVYGESVASEKAGLTLLAKHFIDKDAGNMVLRNEYGLQNDVTAPAVKTLLVQARKEMKGISDEKEVKSEGVAVSIKSLPLLVHQQSFSLKKDESFSSAVLSINHADNFELKNSSLPSGVIFDFENGYFEGIPKECGHFKLTVIAHNSIGRSSPCYIDMFISC